VRDTQNLTNTNNARLLDLLGDVLLRQDRHDAIIQLDYAALVGWVNIAFEVYELSHEVSRYGQCI